MNKLYNFNRATPHISTVAAVSVIRVIKLWIISALTVFISYAAIWQADVSMSAFWKNLLKACAQRGLPFLKSYDGTFFFYKWTHITQACSNTSRSLYPELHFCVKHCSAAWVTSSCASLNEWRSSARVRRSRFLIFKIHSALSSFPTISVVANCYTHLVSIAHGSGQWSVKKHCYCVLD